MQSDHSSNEETVAPLVITCWILMRVLVIIKGREMNAGVKTPPRLKRNMIFGDNLQGRWYKDR